jgi:hypothetical protein
MSHRSGGVNIQPLHPKGGYGITIMSISEPCLAVGVVFSSKLTASRKLVAFVGIS